MECIFCKIASKKLSVAIIAENDFAIAFPDSSPRAPIHLLVIPKKHIVNINDIEPNDKELVWAMLNLVQQISAEYAPDKAFNLIANNGVAAGQSVFHMHWHIIAGKDIYKGGFSL